MLRLIVRLIVAPNHRSPTVTIDRTIGRHDWSYDRSSGAITDLHRSLIATTSRTISYDGSCHRYFRIVRDSATTRRYQSPYATAAGDRSKHWRSFASWPNRNQSYDPEIARSGVTVALVARRLHVIIIWLWFPDKWPISYRSSLLDKLHAWFTVYKLSLNISKTNYVLFGRRRCIADNVSITMGKSPISRVKVTKFLGVNIDENLTWKDHIFVVKSKLSKTIRIMYRASTFLNQSSLFTLYCSLFLPYMTYCLEIWGNTYKSNTLCIFILQKKVLRIIIGANRYNHNNCIF